MESSIYLIQDDGELVEMPNKKYDSEDLLQTLLSKYPALLAGGQINKTAPRRWLLISREMALPSEEAGAGRWSVDHLFLDQDAIPTLVEVKRSDDTRIRREVVGQMLDYAANAVVYWPIEHIRARFETSSIDQAPSAEQRLSEFLGADADPEQFWQSAKTNLQAGKIRLIFVADEIPSELRRIVEFLNTQMDPAEVLAVEMNQYVGRGLRTLAPRVIGQTAEAEKRKSNLSWGERPWGEASFLRQLQSDTTPEVAQVAKQILEWARINLLQISWGRGRKYGSFTLALECQGSKQGLMLAWTYGTIQIWIDTIRTCPPFDDSSKRLELLRRLNTIPGFSFDADSINHNISISLRPLADEESLKLFLDIFNWVVQEMRRA